MAKGKGKKKDGSGGGRERLNPLTGKVEKVGGTKAGRGRMRESAGSPLRTHDLKDLKRS